MSNEVTKCYNSAKPNEVVCMSSVKSELNTLSKKDNAEVKRATGQNYGADYFSEFIKAGYICVSDVSYHLI